MKRTPLKRVSAKKAAWNRKYSLAKQARILLRPCCARCGHRRATQGHHPKGQVGEKIMEFIVLCHGCHAWIHENPNSAREEGLLQ